MEELSKEELKSLTAASGEGGVLEIKAIGGASNQGPH